MVFVSLFVIVANLHLIYSIHNLDFGQTIINYEKTPEGLYINTAFTSQCQTGRTSQEERREPTLRRLDCGYHFFFLLFMIPPSLWTLTRYFTLI